MKLLEELGGIDGLSEKLHTSIDDGIAIKTISKRMEIFGTNFPMIKKMPSFFFFVKECFEDLCLKILLFSAIISLIVGTIQDPGSG